MKKYNYLTAVGEVASIMSYLYRKAGCSEKYIIAYQQWDTVAETIRYIANDTDQINEFENILKYILFKVESEETNNLIKVGLLEEQIECQDIPDIIIKRILSGISYIRNGFTKNLDEVCPYDGDEPDMTKEEYNKLVDDSHAICDFLEDYDARLDEAKSGMRCLGTLTESDFEK